MSRIQPIIQKGAFVSPFNPLPGVLKVMRGFMRAKDHSGIPSEEVRMGG